MCTTTYEEFIFLFFQPFTLEFTYELTFLIKNSATQVIFFPSFPFVFLNNSAYMIDHRIACVCNVRSVVEHPWWVFTMRKFTFFYYYDINLPNPRNFFFHIFLFICQENWLSLLFYVFFWRLINKSMFALCK